MNRNYLTKGEINEIVSACNSFITIDDKNKISELMKFFKVEKNENFDTFISDCRIKIIEYVKKELTKNNRQYRIYISEGGLDGYSRFEEPYMRQLNFNEDIAYIHELKRKYDILTTYRINTIIYQYGLYNINSNLLFIDNYEDYFNKYSRKFVEKQFIELTTKIIDNLNSLLINQEPDKIFHIKEVIKIIVNQDNYDSGEQKAINYLHDVDFFDFEKMNKEKIKKEQAIKDKEIKIEILNRKITDEKQKEIEIENMKLNSVISNDNFLIHQKEIMNKIAEYNKQLKELN